MSEYDETRFINDLDAVLTDTRLMLIAKNRSYADSALSPIKVMSRATAKERLAVRIDDKLSRLMGGTNEFDEDTVHDLLGYLVLTRIADRRQNEKQLPMNYGYHVATKKFGQ